MGRPVPEDQGIVGWARGRLVSQETVVSADQIRASKIYAHAIVAQIIARERARLRLMMDIQLWPPADGTRTLDEELAGIQADHERLAKL
jgi:hypothetical protein